MENIEYEIKLNDDGKPYIYLDDNNLSLEDKFFCLEISKYLLFEIIKDTKKDTKLPENFYSEMVIGGEMISELSNKIGDMLIERNNSIEDLFVGDDNDD